MNLRFNTDPLFYSLAIIGSILYVAYDTDGFKKEELSRYRFESYLLVLLVSAVLFAFSIKLIQGIGKEFFPVNKFGHFFTPDVVRGEFTVRYKYGTNLKEYYGRVSLEYTPMEDEYDSPCTILFWEIKTQNGKIIELSDIDNNCFYDIEKWIEGETINGKRIYIYITNDRVK